MAALTAEEVVPVPALHACWVTMTFLHWRLPAAQVQAMLPKGLTVDEYDGSAWVSLTPFEMGDMRPPGLPELRPLGSRFSRTPGLRRLADARWTRGTNLRTYVRGPDGQDGLWFLSLDIGNPVLAAGLRALVGAQYHVGRLSVDRRGEAVEYTGSRVGGRQAYQMLVRPGRPIVPSELDVWLTGRWRSFTRHLGWFVVTPVEHEAWPLREARLAHLDQNLTDCAGISGLAEPVLVHFSDGVRNVRLGLPRIVR
jgi:uncharacterized protein YqjF (DUF2071 family)